jgi:hypothetical protein
LIQDNHLIKGFNLNILILQLILLSFAAVFHKLAPLMFGGVSLFLIIIPYLLMFLIFFNNINKISIYDFEFLGILLLFAISILFIRTLVYSESFIKSFSGDIYIFFIPISFLIFKNLYVSSRKLNLIRQIILIIILFNFLNSVLYILGLNFFETQFEDSENYIAFSRFSGLFGAPNLSSNALVLLTIIYLLTTNKFKVVRTLLLSFIFFIAVLPNLSRGPLLIFTIFLAIFFLLNIKLNFLNLFLIFISFFILIYFLSYLINNSEFGLFFNSLLDRVEELDGKYGRLDRLTLTFKLLYENIISLVIGIKGSSQIINEDFSISDNSLTLFLANFGLPFTLFFVFLIIRYINYFTISKNKKILYTLVIVSIGIFNNAVLWTVWSLYVIFGYKLLSISNLENQND